MNKLIEKLQVLTESLSLCRDLASDNIVRLDLDGYLTDVNAFIEQYENAVDLEADFMKEVVAEIRDSLIDIMIKVQEVRNDDACLVNCTDIDIAACFEEVTRLLNEAADAGIVEYIDTMEEDEDDSIIPLTDKEKQELQKQLCKLTPEELQELLGKED